MKAAALFVGIVLVVSGSAEAQEIATSFDDLRRHQILSEGDQIRITYAFERGDDYIEAEGKLVSLTDSAITVRFESLPSGTTDLRISVVGDGREIEIPEGRVQRIEGELGDSLINGALYGAAIGFGLLGIPLLIEAQNCPGTGILANFCINDGEALGIGAIGAAIGAGIGVGVDAAMHQRGTLYAAPGALGGSITFSLSPVVTRWRKGLLFTLRW